MITLPFQINNEKISNITNFFIKEVSQSFGENSKDLPYVIQNIRDSIKNQEVLITKSRYILLLCDGNRRGIEYKFYDVFPSKYIYDEICIRTEEINYIKLYDANSLEELIEISEDFIDYCKGLILIRDICMDHDEEIFSNAVGVVDNGLLLMTTMIAGFLNDSYKKYDGVLSKRHLGIFPSPFALASHS